MNIYILYAICFILAYFILFLFKNDFKKIKINLYDEVNDTIWRKIYSILTIVMIHLVWLLSMIFLNYHDNNYIFAFPMILLLPYAIYAYTDLVKNKDHDMSIASCKINMILNILMSIYLVAMIVLILVPNELKSKYFYLILHFLQNLFNKYVHVE